MNPAGRRPAGFVGVLSFWSSVCRDLGDGSSRGGFVDDALVGREGGDEGLDREVVHRARQASADLMDQVRGVVAEQRVAAAGELEVMGLMRTSSLHA